VKPLVKNPIMRTLQEIPKWQYELLTKWVSPQHMLNNGTDRGRKPR
jgi:hypothetical protein